MINNLFKFIQDGGNWTYAELLILAITISIIIERLYIIKFQHHLDARMFMRKIKNMVMDNNTSGAISYCKNIPKALPQIILPALESEHESREKIEDVIETKAIEVIATLEKRTHYLTMLANIAMLTGLLGTVTGLIDSFKAVSNADPSQKASLLAQGISMAMNTTVVGLTIAILTMIFYSVIQASTKKIINDLELYSLQIITLLKDKKNENKKI